MYKWVNPCYYGAIMFYFFSVDIDAFKTPFDFICVSLFFLIIAVIPKVIMVSVYVTELAESCSDFCN